MHMLFVLIFVTCASARAVEKEKIVDGTIAYRGQFPYQISERYNGRHICGGSIIDKYTILTAAHCVDLVASAGINIVVGTNLLDGSGEWFSISHYIVHEDWNPALTTNDIALIKVTIPIKFNTYVKPVAIDDTFTGADVPCVFSGWGMASYPGNLSKKLQYFEDSVVDLNQCIQTLTEVSQFPVQESNICAFSKKGQGACVGDSGGPLVANMKQIGIASWVQPCGVGYPDVFTRVYYYSDWIKARMNYLH